MDVVKTIISLVEKGYGVSTDTRTIRKGDIFFALKGGNFDGNQFAYKALELGAQKVVVDDPDVVNGDDFLLVKDVLETLQKSAALFRNRFSIPVIGITGSNGKTTTKELLYSVLSQKYKVLSTKGNLNNHIGVPLTLFSLNSDHELAIIEMGASEPGEIYSLCLLAAPTLGLVSNVGKAHIEGFGSEEEVCRTKAGLYDYLNENDGISFLPKAIADHPYFIVKQYKNAEKFLPDDMKGPSAKKITLVKDFPYVSIRVQGTSFEDTIIDSQLFGSYNFDNLVNVIKLSDFLGLDVYQWKRGIESYVPQNNRSQVVVDIRGNTIIMDAYNANPSSVSKSLDHFLEQKTDKKKVIILGDMLELGGISQHEHHQVIERLTSYPEIAVILVGKHFLKAMDSGFRQLKHIYALESTEIAKEWWKSYNARNCLVFVKGSRSIKLEALFD